MANRMGCNIVEASSLCLRGGAGEMASWKSETGLDRA